MFAEQWLQDVRYAIRRMRREPAVVCTVVATLALAIGANTALFSLVNALVFRTLPVRNPEQLVMLQATDARGQQNRPIYYSSFAELAKLPSFEGLALYSGGGGFQIEWRGARAEGLIEASTPGLFESLGLQPHLGRFFSAVDSPDDSQSAAVAVLSYQFWQRAFAGDPQVLGDTILIDGTPAVVIGVTPPAYQGFHVDGGYGFSVPLTFLNRQMSTNPSRPVRGLNAVARLAPGVSLSQARAAVDSAWPTLRVETVPAGLSATERQDISTQAIRVQSLSTGVSSLRRQYQDPVLTLWAMTAALLLIGCLNLSGVFLARAVARDQQLAICVALGASRRRIAQQLLVESVLVSLAGAAAAVLLAWWATLAASAVLWQGSSPLSLSMTPDGRVLALTAAVAIATGLIVGVLPVWSACRSRPKAGLRPDRSVARATGRWGRWLLVTQIALSLALLVGAGLLASSLAALRDVDTGVRQAGIRWSRLFAVPNGYRDQKDATYYPELVRQLADVPGVQSVALASLFPTTFGLERLLTAQPIARADGAASDRAAEGVMENLTPRFFETLGIRLVRGRDFSWSDDDRHSAVAIINENLARALFATDDPIGRRVRIGADPRRSAVEVVGVVADATIASYKRPHMPVVFRPRMQELQTARAPVMVFRHQGDPATVDRAISEVIAGLGHEYPRQFNSVDDQINRSLLRERMLAWLSSFFAVLALLLTFLGVYGLLAHAVVRRTREIGVRMAMGASRETVVGMIVGDGLRLTVLGVAVGIPCALVAGRLLRSFLFGLRPWDPTTLVAASGFLLLVGVAAGLWPALRASKVSPAVALRGE